MSEHEKYTPENTEYCTKHDGELVFPDYIEETLRQFIHKRLEEYIAKGITERKIVLPLPSETKSVEDFWFAKAKEIYKDLLLKHSSSFSSEIFEVGEDMNLKETFNILDSRMPDEIGRQSDFPKKKQPGN
jgi:hypothetical protein